MAEFTVGKGEAFPLAERFERCVGSQEFTNALEGIAFISQGGHDFAYRRQHRRHVRLYPNAASVVQADDPAR